MGSEELGKNFCHCWCFIPFGVEAESLEFRQDDIFEAERSAVGEVEIEILMDVFLRGNGKGRERKKFGLPPGNGSSSAFV